ncbi:MAG TPA: class I SAM-dependent methyltransferase, partial [Acidimicrobiia bacterium]
LVDAGHRVIATDASPAMLDIAREYAPGALEHRVVALPDDPIPPADAIVSIGHVLSYLPSEDALDRALIAAAESLRPEGLLALDLCDLDWARLRPQSISQGRVGDDWAIVSIQSSPSPDRYVREMATFLRNDDGTWRRDDERHDNVLIDTARVPALLADHGVDAHVASAFGGETLPAGLMTIIGTKRP